MIGKQVSDERSLVKELIGGNEKAFERLYDAYRDRIYAYSLSLLKSRPYAEEIVQEVFLVVWIKREKLNESLSFKSFLFTIARNKSFDFLKKAANDLRLREEVFYRSQEPYGSSQEKIGEEEIEHIKQQAIDLLPPKRRRIFEMSRNEGKSYEDIGKELGISVSTVKSQMSKALATIRDFLLTKRDITFIILILTSAWMD